MILGNYQKRISQEKLAEIIEIPVIILSAYENKKGGEEMRYIVSILLILIFVSFVYAGSWEDSPYNWNNSPYNWQNSPYNWQNSPYNWDNSRYNYDRDNGIYDRQGNSWGYTIPKSNGGFNIYDSNGNWQGYVK